MTATLTIDQSELRALDGAVRAAVERARPHILKAMEGAMYDAVMDNFGPTGKDRPWPWHPLSEAYARRVGRKHATLQVSGALQASVQHYTFIAGDESCAVVSMDDGRVPYALAHHYGVPDGNRSHPDLPARRVFPLDSSGEVLPATWVRVVEAARQAAREALG